MTIGSTVQRTEVTGSGAVSTYSFGFYIQATGDVDVWVLSNAVGAVPVHLVNSVDYQVNSGSTFNLSGGSITLTNPTYAPLPTGYVLSIQRIPTLLQSTSIRGGGPMYQSSVEDALDKLALVDQELLDAINRSIKLPAIENPANFTTTLPVSALRNNSLIGFDANGNVTVTPTGGPFSGLTPGGVLFGSPTGTITQSSSLSWDNIGLKLTARSLGWVTQALAPDGTTSNPAYSWASAPGDGWIRAGAGLYRFLVGGSTSPIFEVSNGSYAGVAIYSANGASFGVLAADGANILAQKNVSSVQKFRVYGTTTGPHYTEFCHTGTVGYISTNTTDDLQFGAGLTLAWKMEGATNHFKAVTDNTYDIGATGANRPRFIYVGTQVKIEGNSGGACAVLPNGTALRTGQNGGTFYLDLGQLSIRNGDGSTGGADLTLWGSFSFGTDLTLRRAAADILQQSRGVNAQTFRLFKTTDSDSAPINFERCDFLANSVTGYFALDSASGGTGTQRPIAISMGGTRTWQFQNAASGSHFLPIADNVYDLGTGSNRVRSIYWGTQAIAPNGAVGGPSYAFASETNSGWYWSAASDVRLSITGADALRVTSSGVVASAGTIYVGSALDTLLVRDVAGSLALKNGANANSLRVYGTTTGPHYLELFHSGSFAQLKTNTTDDFNFGVNGASVWKFEGTTGHFKAVNDNTYDIGASGAARPRNLFAAGYASVGVQCLTKTSSPYAVPALEQRAEYDNNGAGAQVIFNLPASAVGLVYTFLVLTAQNVRIAGNGSDTIRVAGSISTATTGHIDNATVGGVIRLTCHVSGTWIATYQQGTWTVT